MAKNATANILGAVAGMLPAICSRTLKCWSNAEHPESGETGFFG
jgi:hypothetical protein